jgi:hypothetical protein
MTNLLVQFIVLAVVVALFLWVLAQFPTLDPLIVKFIRIAVLVVLSLLFLNLILVAFFGTGIGHYFPRG